VDLLSSICGQQIRKHAAVNFVAMGNQRVRAIFGIVGGCAVALSAAVVVVTSPAPNSVNACALMPSLDLCTPPDVRRSGFVRKTNPPTITQVAPNSGY
jgi:hypothetical protein